MRKATYSMATRVGHSHKRWFGKLILNSGSHTFIVCSFLTLGTQDLYRLSDSAVWCGAGRSSR